MKRIIGITVISILLFSVYSCNKFNTISNSNIHLSAKFDYSVKNLKVTFTNRTIFLGDKPTYSWDFGDGKTSSDKNPTHTYKKEGTYMVKLTAKQSGQSSTYTEPVKVSAKHNSGGGDLITIDGDFSDWATIGAAVTNKNGGTLKLLKTYYKGGNLYLYVEGTSNLDAKHVYHIYLNTDNNAATGYQYWQYPGGSGAEYLYEGNLFGWGSVFKYTTGNGDATDYGNFKTILKQGKADIGLKVSKVKNLSGGGKALELSIDISKWQNPAIGDTFTLALTELNPNTYSVVGSLPEASTGSAKFLRVKAGVKHNPEGGGGGLITVDGDFSDWATIDAAVTNKNGGTLTLLKTYYKGDIFYLYVEGNAKLNSKHPYHIYLNTDNNAATGFQYWQYPGGSGAEYLYEGNLFGWGTVYKFTIGNGNASDFANFKTILTQGKDDIGIKVSQVKDLSGGGKALELSINISKWQNPTIGDTFTLAFTELNPNSYASIGSLPEASTDSAKFVKVHSDSK